MSSPQQEVKVFNIPLTKHEVKRALKLSKKFAKEIGPKQAPYKLKAQQTHSAAAILGVQNLVQDEQGLEVDANNGVVLGTIRMGFGHYRISLALASAANALNLTPYWLDFLSFPGSAATHIISKLEHLYSLGSRISQRSELFNTFVWEKFTSEVGRPLWGNYRDSQLSALFSPLVEGLPKDIPFIAAHPWTAQAAIAGGLENVVTAIPDNYPIAFHLAEGSLHAVQSPSAYMGFRMLKGMTDNSSILSGDLMRYTGHYVDHELVSNIEIDCSKRFKRLRDKLPKRFLLTIGGAGAQVALFMRIITTLRSKLDRNEVAVWVNLGDHVKRFEELKILINAAQIKFTLHEDWQNAAEFAQEALTDNSTGLHLFLFHDTFPAVYATNLLMRASDVLVTKPSELSFYPVPKLFIKRVGKHEAWGAMRGSEAGDGTLEIRTGFEIEKSVNLLVNDRDLLHLYTTNIIKNKEIGIYDGAYNAVKLALELKKKNSKA